MMAAYKFRGEVGGLTAFKLGEREVIKLFTSRFGKIQGLPIPLGDDVSAVSLGGDKVAVLKVDMLVGITDIPSGMTLQQAGRKSLVMNISDFAAKGVKPLAALVSVGLPSAMGMEEITAVASGLKQASVEYGVPIIGGDTNEARDLTLNCSLFGVAKRNQIILRSEAKPGDLLAVSGRFGKTGAGLRMLLDGRSAPLAIGKRLLEAVYNPQAQLDLGLKLKSLGATASIDSSDGLAWSLAELSTASHVGFRVDTLPIAAEAEAFARAQKLDIFELVFYGGEEYELVVTLDPKRYAKLSRRLKERLLVIGRAVEDSRLTYLTGGIEREIQPKGWEHFKR